MCPVSHPEASHRILKLALTVVSSFSCWQGIHYAPGKAALHEYSWLVSDAFARSSPEVGLVAAFLLQMYVCAYWAL